MESLGDKGLAIILQCIITTEPGGFIRLAAASTRTFEFAMRDEYETVRRGIRIISAWTYGQNSTMRSETLTYGNTLFQRPARSEAATLARLKSRAQAIGMPEPFNLILQNRKYDDTVWFTCNHYTRTPSISLWSDISGILGHNETHGVKLFMQQELFSVDVYSYKFVGGEMSSSNSVVHISADLCTLDILQEIGNLLCEIVTMCTALKLSSDPTLPFGTPKLTVWKSDDVMTLQDVAPDLYKQLMYTARATQRALFYV